MATNIIAADPNENDLSRMWPRASPRMIIVKRRKTEFDNNVGMMLPDPMAYTEQIPKTKKGQQLS